MFSPTVVGTANALAGGIGNSGNDANNLFWLDCTALYYTAFDSPEVHGQGADSPSCSSNLRISRRSAHSVSQLVTTAGLVAGGGWTQIIMPYLTLAISKNVPAYQVGAA